MDGAALIFLIPLLFPKSTGRVMAELVKAYRDAMKESVND